MSSCAGCLVGSELGRARRPGEGAWARRSPWWIRGMEPAGAEMGHCQQPPSLGISASLLFAAPFTADAQAVVGERAPGRENLEACCVTMVGVGHPGHVGVA